MPILTNLIAEDISRICDVTLPFAAATILDARRTGTCPFLSSLAEKIGTKVSGWLPVLLSTAPECVEYRRQRKLDYVIPIDLLCLVGLNICSVDSPLLDCSVMPMPNIDTSKSGSDMPNYHDVMMLRRENSISPTMPVQCKNGIVIDYNTKYCSFSYLAARYGKCVFIGLYQGEVDITNVVAAILPPAVENPDPETSVCQFASQEPPLPVDGEAVASQEPPLPRDQRFSFDSLPPIEF